MKNLELSENRSLGGFALVASLLILSLLLILVVVLMSVVRLESRAAQSSQLTAEARHSALSALQIAIGEIQLHTGADTRVTAPADLLNPGAPALVGAWKSWEGTDHRQSDEVAPGRPIAPDYDSKLDPVSAGGRFITWLVSGAVNGQNISDPAMLLFSDPDDAPSGVDTVPLLAQGSLGNSSGREIHVPLLDVNLDGDSQPEGKYAWWVSPENQKARLSQPHEPRSDDIAGWSDLAKSHAIADPEAFGLDDLLADPENFDPQPGNPKVGRKVTNLSSTAILKASLDPGNTNPVEPDKNFHDFSTTAVGLLTNTATGGWRKDLSILTEKWDDIYDADSDSLLPLFRYSPDPADTSQVPKTTTANYGPAQSNFYPWSEYTPYSFSSNLTPMTLNAASASWRSLVSFATAYKTLNFDTGTQTANAPIGWGPIISDIGRNPTNGVGNGVQISNSDYERYYHDFNLNPVLARTQFIIQANALPHPNPDGTIVDPALNHLINLRVVPYFTLWNPYNVEIVKTSSDPEFGINVLRTVPLSLSIINGTEPPAGGLDAHYKLLNSGATRDQSFDGDGKVGQADHQISGNPSDAYYPADFVTWLPYTFSLKPGEVKIFAPQTDGFSPDGIDFQFNLLLKQGYAGAPDFGIPLADPSAIASSPTPNAIVNRFIKVPGRTNNELHSGDTVRFAVKADRLTQLFSGTNFGAGGAITIGTFRLGEGRTRYMNGETNRAVDRLRAAQTIFLDQTWAQNYWSSDDLDIVEYSVSELTPGGGNPPWTNIISMSFGPRVSIGSAAGDAQSRPTKGLLQSNPFAYNAFSAPLQSAESHPANGAYDIFYHSMTINDALTPEIDTAGFIATGFQSGDGLSNLIMAEIPLRPMASLVELQSWNLRGNNPFPPHQYNLIGNSDATPMIEQDSVLAGTPITTDPATNLQHDDAYCANHLLFDDWFVSSIADQPATFGSNIDRNIETVYQDFLTGDEQLINRAYQPIVEDRDLSPAQAGARATEIVNSPDGDGWLKVASRLEVEGMFNVNSTSVAAWRALLGHARDKAIAHHTTAGMVLDQGPYDHAVSRSTVAFDVQAGTAEGIGAAFPSGSEYTGFRALTDSQLDDLSEKIVDQIRERGPFLSLAEFINRQLSLDGDLAIAGALQAALNNLTVDPLAVLKDTNNLLSSDTMDPTNPALSTRLDGVGYSFEEAAAGLNTHGFPGWIRQADILRPIAPILSARDDTFTIRAYGDSRDSNGNVVARAWCEAVVQRSRDYVDPADESDSADTPTSGVNQDFGRKYIIKSFRWLNAEEV